MRSILYIFCGLPLVCIGYLLCQTSTIEEYQQLYTPYHTLPCEHVMYDKVDPCKQLYIEGKGLVAFIESKSSTVCFNNKHECIEQLSHVHCIIQQELFYSLQEGDLQVAESIPMQKLSIIDADTATFDYHLKRLTAQHVHMQQCIMPGHELPKNTDTAIMQGYAAYVECAFKDSFEIQAEGLTTYIKENHVQTTDLS